MINPQQPEERRSPYSSAVNSSAPQQSIPSVPVSTLAPLAPKKRPWGKWVGFFILTFLSAAVTFGYSEYRSVRDAIISTHEGTDSSILKQHIDANSTIVSSDYTHPGDGRFNMVVVGVGGDAHPGSYLTDTIQVISVDTINKKTSSTSIPRDLYVNIPGYGRGKINSVYELAEQTKAGSGPEAVRQVVGNVLGITITNFALIDFSGIKEVVDTLGGIDVTAPKAISDPFFPCDDTIRYCPFYIKAGQQHMTGEIALEYSRSRETTSDFDRAARQQIVMQAIKAKALSVGFLANPLKISDLLNVLGRHFKTDMQTDDISSFISVYKSIPATNTSNFVIDTSAQLGLLTDTTDPVAGYINYPVLGINNYDAIHQWWQSNNEDPLLAREAPSVTLINNGHATTKQMDAMKEKLTDYGYTVTVSDTPLVSGNYTTTQIFAKDSSKPISSNYISSILGVHVQSGTVSDSGSNFEIIVTPTSMATATTPKPTSTPTASPTASSSPTSSGQ